MTSSAQPSRAPYKLNPADVSKLREATDCPMMECKKFLVQYEGDFEKAKAALLRGDWKYGKLITYARPGSRHQASPPSPAPAPAPEAPAPATPTLISSCFGDLFVQEEMVKTLSVTAEGRLMHNIWQRGRKGTPGHYAQEDVTDSAHEFLFEQLQLQSDVTIRSVLLLVSNCEGLRRVLRRRQIDNILQEALGPLPSYSLEGGIDPADVEFACVYRSLERHSGTKELSGVSGMMLHGLSRVYEQDVYEGDMLMHRKGTRSGYSFEWTSARRLLDLPLKLDEEVVVSEGNLNLERFWEQSQTLHCTELSLAELLDAVTSELAWVGPPQDEASTLEI